MRRLISVLGVVLISLSVGCSDDTLLALGEEGCVSDDDCATGLVCIDAACLPSDLNTVVGLDPGEGEDDGGSVEPSDDSDPSDPDLPDDYPPEDDEEEVTPDPTFPTFIGGAWLTEYHFDWSEYLGPLADFAEPLDWIDQVLIGNETLNQIPFLGDLLQEVVDNYIPEWLADLVHILNGIVQFFQDVRIDAQMDLAHVNGSPFDVTGTEDWQRATVIIIDGCEYGLSDPTYPGCAEVSVPLNRYVTDFGVIGAEALPFEGTIANDIFSIEDRQVRFQIAQLVTYILNYVTDLASQGQYTTFESVLTAAIDCAGLSQDLDATLCGLGICGQQATIENVCVGARDAAIGQLMSTLDAIMVEWEIMHFDQAAQIFDYDQDGNADELGNPTTSPGTISDGGFEVVIGAGLYGEWWALRP